MIGKAKGDDRDLDCYTCDDRKTNISSDEGNFDDKIEWNEECVIRDRNLIFGMIMREVLSGTVKHAIGKDVGFCWRDE